MTPITAPETFATPEAVTPAMNDIIHELTIKATAPAVFDAITTKVGRRGWWPGGGDHELEAGQVAPLTVAGNDIVVQVEVADRPEVVQWICAEGPREWVGTSIGFRIEQIPVEPTEVPLAIEPAPETVVRFWHGGWEYEDGLLPRASFEWAMLLDRLRWHLEAPTPANPG
jgi:uncharacterized protein YndB with AHSA1/START domain